jgi:hypothetical protein
MSGSGKAAGTTFRPRSAVVNYNKVDGVYVIYLTPEAATCGLHFSQTRLLEVVIVSTKPLIVGAPSLRKGENNYVSVSFKITQSHSFVTSKRVKLVLTRVDSRTNKLWHGRLTVPTTKIEKDTVSFKGTFAARWCGRFP